MTSHHIFQQLREVRHSCFTNLTYKYLVVVVINLIKNSQTICGNTKNILLNHKMFQTLVRCFISFGTILLCNTVIADQEDIDITNKTYESQLIVNPINMLLDLDEIGNYTWLPWRMQST
jgi:hypothetical protein